MSPSSYMTTADCRRSEFTAEEVTSCSTGGTEFSSFEMDFTSGTMGFSSSMEGGICFTFSVEALDLGKSFDAFSTFFVTILSDFIMEFCSNFFANNEVLEVFFVKGPPCICLLIALS